MKASLSVVIPQTVYISLCVYDLHLPAGLQLEWCSKKLMLLTRDCFFFFLRRSGEWTHTDWLCHCVKGYPVSCRLALPLPPDSRSRKSWISHLCLTLCLCVWIQETSDSLKSLDSITRTNNVLTFLWSLWVMTWSEGIWRWISFFYLTYFYFCLPFSFPQRRIFIPHSTPLEKHEIEGCVIMFI